MENLVQARRWAEQLEQHDSALYRRLARGCGGQSTIDAENLCQYKRAVQRFIEHFGADRQIGIVRSPGRLNVLGMHIDHRGGFVNPMALSQEVVLVFSPADDDLVDVDNLNPQFGGRSFRISDVRPEHPIHDQSAWLDWTQQLKAARNRQADWIHKLAGPCAYLAGMLCPERPLKGFQGVMTGNIMQQVGLSSSSGVVVSSMLAMTAANGLDLDLRSLVEHCGIAEWYVGTRGGFGDHAAILYGRAGQLTRVRTVPELVVSGYTPFSSDYRLLVFHSGFAADKTGAAGNTFNERTATYELAEMLAARHLCNKHAALWDELEHARRNLGNPKPMHLGDIAERLTPAQIYHLLAAVPEQADRETLRTMLPESDHELHRQFATHAEPASGYPLRQVLLYGISECARAARGADLLAHHDGPGFGHLMNVSHDGDRVSGLNGKLTRLKSGLDTTLPVWEQPGDYACSTPEVDEMVDIALATGALGAQISGAGLGGSMMALVPAEHKDALVRAMLERYYQPRNIEPRHLEAVPSAGAAVI